MTWSEQELKDRFEELVAFLKSKGHSEDRARQIAGNHGAIISEEFEKAQKPKEERNANDAERESGLEDHGSPDERS